MPEQPSEDRSTPIIVSYGEWEPYYPKHPRYRAFLKPLMGLFGGVIDSEPVREWRRKRFETWHDSEGRQMGRWTWDYRNG